MKKTALTLLKIVITVGLYVYIFSKIDIAHLWSILKDAKLSYFVLGVLLYMVNQAVSAYRWYLLLGPPGLRTSYLKLFSYYLLGMYFNNLMPSSIGGDVFRVYFLNRETGKLSASTASVFLDRDIGMAGLMFVATVVAAFAGTTIQGVPLAPIFVAIDVAFIAANLAIFYRPTYNLLHKMLRLVKLKKADERVERLFSSVNSYRGKWGLVVVTMALSLAVQVGCVFVNMLAADSIDMVTRNGWIDYLVFVPTVGLIGLMPLSLNGMGWREFAYIMLFQTVITNASSTQEAGSKAAALAFLWFGIIVATSLPGGVLYLLQGGRRKKVDEPASGITGTPPVRKQGEAEIPLAPDRDVDQFPTITASTHEESSVSTI